MVTLRGLTVESVEALGESLALPIWGGLGLAFRKPSQNVVKAASIEMCARPNQQAADYLAVILKACS